MRYFGSDIRDRLSHTSSHHRLGAFCDGVFAIAITLLIIELHSPEIHDADASSLTRALLAKWPQYFSYVLSFVTIGTYWINHHFVFNLIEKTNHIFTLLTMLLLLTVTFMPFPTAVLGDYLANPEMRQSAIRFYLAGLTAPSLVWWVSWEYARRAALLPSNLKEEYIRCMSGKYRASVLIFLLLWGLSWLSPLFSLISATAMTAAYLVPIPKPVVSA